MYFKKARLFLIALPKVYITFPLSLYFNKEGTSIKKEEGTEREIDYGVESQICAYF